MLLRVVTYNIHKCIGGLDRQYRPERIRDVITHYQPDVVFLQEVDAGAKRSRCHRQIDVLGDLLDLRHRAWFPNVSVRGGGQYGNGILSRFPLLDADNIDVTLPPKKRRAVLHARCRVRLGRHTRTVHFFGLHLGLSGIERKSQLRRFVASEPLQRLHQRTPVVVAGDFNDVWGTLWPKVLAPAGFQGPPRPIRTFPAYAPLRALDSVYVRGSLDLLHARTSRLDVAREASDHLPIIAEIQLS